LTRKARRRIVKADIEFVSLCPAGKNLMPVVFKEDGAFEFRALVKSRLAEEGTITALVYVPEHVDADGDVASAEAIKGFCYAHAKRGAKIDLRHNGRSLSTDEAYVAENFIVQKGDARFVGMKDSDGHDVDATDAWAQVIKIESEPLRAEYRDGKWGGVSMFGRAQVQAIKEASAEAALVDELAKRLLAATTNGGDDVDKKEVEEVVKAGNESLVKTIGEAFTAALAPVVKALMPAKDEKKDESTSKTAEVPVFKGDRSNPEDLRKHQLVLEEYELAKDVDFADAKQVGAYVEKLEAVRKARVDAAKDKPGVKPVGKAARLPSAAATAAAAATVAKGEEADEDDSDAAEIRKSADEIAAFANRRYGHKPVEPAKA